MNKNKENVCLDALDRILGNEFDKDEYGIQVDKESAICIIYDSSKWLVYEKEKNSKNELMEFNNVVEACLNMIKRMFLTKSDIYIGEFLEIVINSKIA